MDATLAIEHDRQALRRIVAGLVAMAGLADHRATLPRRLRNALLRVVRPAEAAARRLVIALARGLAVPAAASNKRADTARQPNKIQSRALPSRGLATGIVWPASMAPVPPAPPLRPHALLLFDPLRKPFARRKNSVPAHLMPRISAPGVADARPFTPPPTQDDPCDARRLVLRLEALTAALDDLPKQALRFARWQARHAWSSDHAAQGYAGGALAAQAHGNGAPAAQEHDGRLASADGGRTARRKKAPRRWPLRPGRPPGTAQRRRHEVQALLAHAHQLAVYALSRPDTS